MRKAILAGAAFLTSAAAAAPSAPQYRDLNHNGRLDRYEDKRQPIEARVADLVGQMTLQEKVGTLLHGTLPAVGNPFGASDKGYDLPAIERLISNRKITSMITRLSSSPAAFADANNTVQRMAERSRLGIPVTISTDPRNHFRVVGGASVQSNGFSQWPEPLGFAAIGDAALVRRFGAIAAGEYRAVGIHMALSPQADLATEPRWSRTNGTFGADPSRVSRLAGAYVEGFQGGARGVGPQGVATITKHWLGYGAEPEGFDAHSRYGRTVKLDDASFARHLAAFRGPLAAHTAGMMPTYAIVSGVSLDGRPLEPVGAGFSIQLVVDLLRGRERYDGLIVSDWGITGDCPEACAAPTASRPQGFAIGMPWGVEKLSQVERFAKGVAAGIDQFGGADDPQPLIDAVRSGQITPARLDDSVSRVMRVKFRLGLFDNPFVDPEAAARSVGNAASQADADRAQRAAQVLIQNSDGVLPLRRAGLKVWLSGLNADAARKAGLVPVTRLEEAEIAIVRIAAPFERLHPNHFFGMMQNEGRLDWRDGDGDYETVKKAAARVPTIVAVDMDRPAILTNVIDKTKAVVALFGASDAALLDVLTGRAAPAGRLPLELPRSMAAVERQDPAASDDSQAPLFPAGYGLSLRR